MPADSRAGHDHQRTTQQEEKMDQERSAVSQRGGPREPTHDARLPPRSPRVARGMTVGLGSEVLAWAADVRTDDGAGKLGVASHGRNRLYYSLLSLSLERCCGHRNFARQSTKTRQEKGLP